MSIKVAICRRFFGVAFRIARCARSGYVNTLEHAMVAMAKARRLKTDNFRVRRVNDSVRPRGFVFAAALGALEEEAPR
jgi:hypothetical protein